MNDMIVRHRISDFLIKRNRDVAAFNHRQRISEISQPAFSFLYNKLAQSFSAMLRKHNNPADHRGLRIQRIKTAGCNGKIIIR